MAGQTQKFDRLKMFDLLKEGKTQTEVAKILGVSIMSINKASRILRTSVVKMTTMEASHKIELDVVDQLYKSNKRIDEIAEDLMAKIRGEKSETPDLIGNKDIRIILKEFEEERRKQLNFQVEIFKTLSDFKIMAEFQKEVIDLVGNANKCPHCGEEVRCAKCGEKIDLREKLIKGLREAKALRASVQVRP